MVMERVMGRRLRSCCASRAARRRSLVVGRVRRRLAGARRLLAVLVVARELDGRLLPTLLDVLLPQKEENMTCGQKIMCGAGA